jgi:hypothetical protein
MASMDEFNIRDFDIKQIIHFLLNQQEKRYAGKVSEEKLGIGKKLLYQKCTLCHGLERIYNAPKTKEAWMITVNRMIDTVGDKKFLMEDEKEQIINYLASKKQNQ